MKTMLLASSLPTAMVPKVRTKHISLKGHHFKDQLRSGAIKIIKIASNLNWADIQTKPLCKTKHDSLRKFIMGW
jgi:hypothetical protein